ncbi:family 2 glycosyl transferase [Calothrix sp. NIES-4071]|nr:family 2 glycosyl transferase [Calothrix sp. NIES-4071]BAZ55877.1 family 2 glycosyl transferase [Calothrix sp. NIES-4105]
MSRQPLVSVITPFLNAEKFFEEAIESVIAQTYNNWELLLVDDGSTDASTLIAKRYAQQYPNQIHYLEHPNHQNQGKSVSRNLGIDKAKGEYIALLDADDVFLPQKLEKQVAILETQPQAAMVYGPTQYWYSWTGSQDSQRDFLGKLGVKPDTLFDPPTLLTLFLKDGGIVPCTCGLLARLEVVRALGAFEEAIQHMYEDQVFIAKICLQSPVFVESGCWDKYRQHPDSSSYIAIRTGEYHPRKPNPARRAFLIWLVDYLSEQGIKDAELWRFLNKQLRPYRYPLIYRFWSLIKDLIRAVKPKFRNKYSA